MKDMKVRVGQELLRSATFVGNWNTKKLHETLLEMQDADAASDNPRIAKMGIFYLKIYGHYPDEIIDKDTPKCVYCPDNSAYSRYHDYNELRDEKEKVLVLKSEYNDFREYDICCAYYSDKKTLDRSIVMKEGEVNVNEDDATTVIELYGTKKSFWDKVKEKLFHKEFCM